MENDEPVNENSYQSEENTEEDAAANENHLRISTRTILIICGVLLLIFAVIWYFGVRYAIGLNPDPHPLVNQEIRNDATPQVSLLPPETTPAIAIASVQWLPRPQKVASVGLFAKTDPYYPFQFNYSKTENAQDYDTMKIPYEPKATYYLVGTVKDGEYKGGSVYLTTVYGLPNNTIKGIPEIKDITYNYNMSLVFIKMPDGTFIVTKDYDYFQVFCDQTDCYDIQKAAYGSKLPDGVKMDTQISVDPYSSKNPYEDHSRLVFIHTNTLFSPTGLIKVKDMGNNAALYATNEVSKGQIPLEDIAKNTYIIKLPTGMMGSVQYSPTLVLKHGEINPNDYTDYEKLQWVAPSMPNMLPKELTDRWGYLDTIQYTDVYEGCDGISPLREYITKADSIDTENGLERVATTDAGETLYDIKDKHYAIFKAFYNDRVVKDTDDNTFSYDAFLALSPILLWKDAFGSYRLVFREGIARNHCMAEPLLYLYPQNQTNIRIAINPKIRLSESQPAYNGNWNVVAYPNGMIQNLSDQKRFPYLYWEGSTSIDAKPVLASVVSELEIHEYFEKQLSKLGLTVTERKDFERYWEPKLHTSPYYLISFYDATTLNQLVPYEMSPQPDTFIRVLMSYQRLSKRISIEETGQNYTTPNRKGFTAVEWGGILKK